MRTVPFSEGWGEEHKPAEKYCITCGADLDDSGLPVQPHTYQAVFSRLAWEFREDPVRTAVMLYRITDQSMTLQDIADSLTSLVATVHNRRPYVTRQAIMDTINRICEDRPELKGILCPRKGNE